jgi:hypothetical protein
MLVLVAKALCANQNGEMHLAGPTLELIETAWEWHHNGRGRSLLESIQDFYRKTFQEALGQQGGLRFYASYVT